MLLNSQAGSKGQYKTPKHCFTPCGCLSVAHEHDISPDERQHLHLSIRMQVWLAIHNILTGPEARAKALASSAAQSAALRLRPLLTDVLMDQLPVLRNLRRVLDELMLGCTGAARTPLGGCLIIEQVKREAPPGKIPHIVAEFINSPGISISGF